jgi:hypothetical protein
MPNTFAYLMLLIWPVACLVLFRRLAFERALVWSLLGGYLLLPPLAAFDLPLVPALDKYSIPSLSVLLICIFVLGKPVRLWPDNMLARMLLVLFLLSVIPTVLTNTDAIPFWSFATDPDSRAAAAPGGLPGMSIRDLASVLVTQMIVLIPFVLARQFLSTPSGLKEILLALAVGALAYSLPALIEIRLSPQINTWIYGFFQHDFSQMMRKGGFRPIVFLPHALWLSFFVLTAILSAAALARYGHAQDRTRWVMLVVYLLAVLYLCKSLGAWVFALTLTPLVLLAPAQFQIRMALLCALIAIIYPMLRNLGVIPLEAVLAQAEAIDVERASSLAFRFNNEEQLLDRAQDKPLFGWGAWGRNLIRDPLNGNIATIPDGRWIIVFGSYGWLGYIAEMGLLALPLVLLARMSGAKNSASNYVAAIAIILAATMLDMLINATLTPYTWLCAGAILGFTEQRHSHESTDQSHVPSGVKPVIQTGNGQIPKPEI